MMPSDKGPERVEVLEIVQRCLEVKLASEGVALSDPINKSTPLSEGAGGFLDSLGLVVFLVELEYALEERFGRSCILAGDVVVFEDGSIMKTVESLGNYVYRVLHKTVVENV